MDIHTAIDQRILDMGYHKMNDKFLEELRASEQERGRADGQYDSTAISAITTVLWHRNVGYPLELFGVRVKNERRATWTLHRVEGGGRSETKVFGNEDPAQIGTDRNGKKVCEVGQPTVSICGKTNNLTRDEVFVLIAHLETALNVLESEFPNG